MRVGLFVTYGHAARTGHASYQQALIEGLLRQDAHQILLIAAEGEAVPPVPEPHSVLRYAKRRGREHPTGYDMHYRAARAARRAGVGALVANGNWPAPRLRGVPTAFVLYEAAFGDAPWGMYSPRFLRRLSRDTHAAIGCADAVIAISQATADEARRVRPGVRTVVSYPAAVPFDELSPTSPHAGPYVVSVGWFHPRKELPLALRAWRVAMQNGLDRDLVLVGDISPADLRHGTVGRRVLDQVGQELAARVRIVGSVGRRRLGEFLQHADALLVTSSHEGFGIPAVEAYSVGTPVVAVDRGALREAAGADAVVAPDPAAIAAALCAVTTGPVPREVFRARAARFSVDGLVRPVLELLDEWEAAGAPR